MKKSFLILLLLVSSIFADRFSFDDIETSILSKKSGEPVNIELSLVLEGRDISQSRVELMDTIQSVVGGFWAETLVTSQGKESFKKSVVAVADKKYGIEVDYVYILNLKVQTCTLEKLKELLKK